MTDQSRINFPAAPTTTRRKSTHGDESKHHARAPPPLAAASSERYEKTSSPSFLLIHDAFASSSANSRAVDWLSRGRISTLAAARHSYEIKREGPSASAAADGNNSIT